MFRKKLFCILLISIASLWLTQSAFAANINVDLGNSIRSNDGSCSLREAIENANSGSQVFTSAGECEAGTANTDTIYLNVSVGLTQIDNTTDGSALDYRVSLHHYY